MKIFGIDASLTGFAVCLYQDGIVQYQNVIQSKFKGVRRLNEILQFLETCFEEFSLSKFDIIVLEGYSFGSQGQGLFSLAELGGVVKLFLFRKGIEPMIVPPTVLKKFVTGKGSSTKDIIIKEVFRKWSFDTSNNNLADAYALVKFAEAVFLVSQNKTEKYTKNEIEVIKNWQKSRTSEVQW